MTSHFYVSVVEKTQVCAYLAASEETSNCPGCVRLRLSKCGLSSYILCHKLAVFALIPMLADVVPAEKG